MTCFVHHRRTDLVEVWVPRAVDEETVQATVAHYTSQGYRVTIYRAGAGDVVDLTGELLRVNLR